MRKPLGSILFIVAVWVTLACEPSKKVKVEEKSRAIPAVAVTGLTEAVSEFNPALIGSWSACEASQSETLSISGITHYLIKDDHNMVVSFAYFSDSVCKVPFGEADATQAVKAWELHYKEKAGDDVKDYYKSLVTGFSQESTYSASLVKAGETGTFDQTTHFDTAFLSYKIVGDSFYLTEACLPSEIVVASDTNCTIVGETAEHRSNDFTKVVPFKRN